MVTVNMTLHREDEASNAVQYGEESVRFIDLIYRIYLWNVYNYFICFNNAIIASSHILFRDYLREEET